MASVPTVRKFSETSRKKIQAITDRYRQNLNVNHGFRSKVPIIHGGPESNEQIHFELAKLCAPRRPLLSKTNEWT